MALETDPMPGDSAAMVCPMEPIYVLLRDHIVPSSPITVEKTQVQGVESLETPTAGGQHQ